MVEVVRTIEIHIRVDTNKRTESQSFDNMDEAVEWFDEVMESI